MRGSIIAIVVAVVVAVVTLYYVGAQNNNLHGATAAVQDIEDTTTSYPTSNDAEESANAGAATTKYIDDTCNVLLENMTNVLPSSKSMDFVKSLLGYRCGWMEPFTHYESYEDKNYVGSGTMIRSREAPWIVKVDLGEGYSVKFGFNNLTGLGHFDRAPSSRRFDGDMQFKSGDCKGTSNGKLEFEGRWVINAVYPLLQIDTQATLQGPNNIPNITLSGTTSSKNVHANITLLISGETKLENWVYNHHLDASMHCTQTQISEVEFESFHVQIPTDSVEVDSELLDFDVSDLPPFDVKPFHQPVVEFFANELFNKVEDFIIDIVNPEWDGSEECFDPVP